MAAGDEAARERERQRAQLGAAIGAARRALRDADSFGPLDNPAHDAVIEALEKLTDAVDLLRDLNLSQE